MCGKTDNCGVANATALFAELSESLFQAQDRLEPVLGKEIYNAHAQWKAVLGDRRGGCFVQEFTAARTLSGATRSLLCEVKHLAGSKTLRHATVRGFVGIALPSDKRITLAKVCP